MGRVGRRRRVVFFGLTTTKDLIIDVGWGSSIHHGCVAIHLPRVVEDRWRREVHGLANGRVLNVGLSEYVLLASLQLDELLIHILPVSMNFLSIVLPNIEASKEALRKEVEDALLLTGGNGVSRR
jgi:preprotein translocase subunit Sec63